MDRILKRLSYEIMETYLKLLGTQPAVSSNPVKKYCSDGNCRCKGNLDQNKVTEFEGARVISIEIK